MRYAESIDNGLKGQGLEKVKTMMPNSPVNKMNRNTNWHFPTLSKDQLKCEKIDNLNFDKQEHRKTAIINENELNHHGRIRPNLYVQNSSWFNKQKEEDRKPICDDFGNYKWSQQNSSFTNRIPGVDVGWGSKQEVWSGGVRRSKEEWGGKMEQGSQVEPIHPAWREDNRSCHWIIKEDKKPVVELKPVS